MAGNRLMMRYLIRWQVLLPLLAIALAVAACFAFAGKPALNERLRTLVDNGTFEGAAIYSSGKLQTFGAIDTGKPLHLASLSKVITAETILLLVDQGKVSLDDRLIKYAPELAEAVDPRYRDITIDHLLRHQGGWDRSGSFDPIYRAYPGRPPTCEGIARDFLVLPLQFKPGTRAAYSNLGYCWLALVVERASGVPYSEFARRHVLRDVRFGSTEGTLLGSGNWTAPLAAIEQFFRRPPNQKALQVTGFVTPYLANYGRGWNRWDMGDGHVAADGGGHYLFAVHHADGTATVAVIESPHDARHQDIAYRSFLGF